MSRTDAVAPAGAPDNPPSRRAAGPTPAPDGFAFAGGYSAVYRGGWLWTICLGGEPLRLPCGDLVSIDGDGEEVRAFLGAIAAPPLALPAEMTPAIDEVLGIPNFIAGPYAHLFRAAGAEIRPKAEAEQAFVLWWLLRLVLQHGDAWRDRADADLAAARATVQAKRSAGSQP